MFSVLVIRLRSLRLLRVSGIVMRLRMFLLLITFLKASHSFSNLLLVFFISSRRRHTRFQGDWSSDVCSSDLEYRCRAGDHIVRVDVGDGKVAHQLAADEVDHLDDGDLGSGPAATDPGAGAVALQALVVDRKSVV